jgi:predicted helicase
VKSSVELILKELHLSDLEKIVISFQKSGDPILNFYEPFLQNYDPQTKKERGVFYAQKAVVDFFVRETNTILKTELNLENGFLERNVKVLEPATGNREPLDKIFFQIAMESEKAKAIKNDKNIIAIIGNPPYSGTSQNPSKVKEKNEKSYEFGKIKNLTWIGSQIENYKWNGTKKLDEKNPKWLQDDYVKFIRFAQYQIDSKEKGVISYIVPHGFLDNPTFRYMRKSLLDSFSKIFIVNLHGNSTKKETTPNGKKDENVFDIKQGVSLLFLVKTSSAKETKIYYGDLFGTRKKKFTQLTHRKLEKICKTELFSKNDMFYW